MTRSSTTSPLIEELLSLRAEEAGLLGLGTFAGLRLQTRMARDAREVTEFLRDLAARAKPLRAARPDRAARLCRRRAGPGRTAALGRALCLRAPARIALRLLEDEVKQYFTEPRVLAGLYEVIETLFNVRLVETPVSSWHADVRGVRVESPEGALIGHLYLTCTRAPASRAAPGSTANAPAAWPADACRRRWPT